MKFRKFEYEEMVVRFTVFEGRLWVVYSDLMYPRGVQKLSVNRTNKFLGYFAGSKSMRIAFGHGNVLKVKVGKNAAWIIAVDALIEYLQPRARKNRPRALSQSWRNNAGDTIAFLELVKEAMPPGNNIIQGKERVIRAKPKTPPKGQMSIYQLKKAVAAATPREVEEELAEEPETRSNTELGLELSKISNELERLREEIKAHKRPLWKRVFGIA
jgi:hypothetical protein